MKPYWAILVQNLAIISLTAAVFFYTREWWAFALLIALDTVKVVKEEKQNG